MKFRITLNHLYDKYITPQGKNHLILINNDKEIISLMYICVIRIYMVHSKTA